MGNGTPHTESIWPCLCHDHHYFRVTRFDDNTATLSVGGAYGRLPWRARLATALRILAGTDHHASYVDLVADPATARSVAAALVAFADEAEAAGT